MENLICTEMSKILPILLIGSIFFAGCTVESEEGDNPGNLQRVQSFPGESDTVLLANPMGFASDRDSIIFVADNFPSDVKVFSADGDYLQTLGRKGRGPEEFYHPFAITVNEEGKVFIADGGNLRLQIYDSNGRFLEMFTHEHTMGSIASAGELIYAFNPPSLMTVGELGEMDLVHVYRPDGTIENRFGEYLTVTENIPAGLSWPYMKIDGGHLHLAFRYFPIYRVYNLEGALLAEIDMSEFGEISGMSIDADYDKSSFHNPGEPDLVLNSSAMDVYDQSVYLARPGSDLVIDHFRFRDNKLAYIDTYSYWQGPDRYSVVDLIYHPGRDSFYALEYVSDLIQITEYALKAQNPVSD